MCKKTLQIFLATSLITVSLVGIFSIKGNATPEFEDYLDGNDKAKFQKMNKDQQNIVKQRVYDQADNMATEIVESNPVSYQGFSDYKEMKERQISNYASSIQTICRDKDTFSKPGGSKCFLKIFRARASTFINNVDVQTSTHWYSPYLDNDVKQYKQDEQQKKTNTGLYSQQPVDTGYNSPYNSSSDSMQPPSQPYQYGNSGRSAYDQQARDTMQRVNDALANAQRAINSRPLSVDQFVYQSNQQNQYGQSNSGWASPYQSNSRPGWYSPYQ